MVINRYLKLKLCGFRVLIFGTFSIIFSFLLDLTPNSDNTRDLHPSMRGNVNLEVTFKEATQTTITVLMYTASSGGISVGKDFDVQMLSSDY